MWSKVQQGGWGVDHLSNSQEEADTILVFRALQVARSGAEVQIISPDTDVLLLALRRYPQLGHKSSLVTDVGGKRRTTFLKLIYDSIGAPLADTLPGFRAFTGCDTKVTSLGKDDVRRLLENPGTK